MLLCCFSGLRENFSACGQPRLHRHLGATNQDVHLFSSPDDGTRHTLHSSHHVVGHGNQSGLIMDGVSSGDAQKSDQKANDVYSVHVRLAYDQDHSSAQEGVPRDDPRHALRRIRHVFTEDGEAGKTSSTRLSN